MIQTLSKRRGDEGFTLIELLVVIVILGILAAVVVFAVGGIGDKGQAKACDADKKTIQVAEEAYAAQPTPQGGGGLYTDSGTLATKHYLTDPPTLHSAAPTGTPVGTTYSITNLGACA